MNNIQKIIDDISKETNISFQLIINDVKYSSESFDETQDYIQKCFDFNITKCYINVYVAFSYIFSFLKIILEYKLKEVFIDKKDILISLFEKKSVDLELIENNFEVNMTKMYLINIYVAKNIDNVYFFIKEGYISNNIEIFTYKDILCMFGEFDEIKEHILSIKETIEENYRENFYISYCKVEDINCIEKVYYINRSKLDLAVRYNVNYKILDNNKLILEYIIDSIKDTSKKDIYIQFKDRFLKLDIEIIKSIEVFLKCGLNLSEASKELFIHRNTLIYRLDKVQRITGYDVRKFEDAVIFKITFFIFKEKSMLK